MIKTINQAADGFCYIRFSEFYARSIVFLSLARLKTGTLGSALRYEKVRKSCMWDENDIILR